MAMCEAPLKLSINSDAAGGFDFSNVKREKGSVLRNLTLGGSGMSAPKTTSTGTTIVGSVFKGGVVIGADSRATEGNIIADKNCDKLHKITDSIYAAGAGTAADLDQVCRMLSAQMRLIELNTGRPVRVITVLRHAKQYLFKYMGYVGAYLLIAGVDEVGPELYEVSANGTTTQGPFAADGSGSLNAMNVLETNFKAEMTKDEAVNLVMDGLRAGMHGDLASGNSLRYVAITKDGGDLHANIKPEFTVSAAKDVIKFKPKVTVRLSETEKVLLRSKVKAKGFEVVEHMDVQ